MSKAYGHKFADGMDSFIQTISGRQTISHNPLNTATCSEIVIQLMARLLLRQHQVDKAGCILLKIPV